MNYTYKFYHFENRQKGENLTQFLQFPLFIEEKLDDTLDTAKVVLSPMPIEKNSTYQPKTKFVLEQWTNEVDSEPRRVWHFVCEHDDVEEHIGTEFCTHHLNLIEPSVIAQGMHCDNLALTYELRDVNMNYSTITVDPSIIGQDLIVRTGGEPNRTLQTQEFPVSWSAGMNTFYFRRNFNYVWSNTSSLANIRRARDGEISHSTNFYHSNTNLPSRQWQRLYECVRG